MANYRRLFRRYLFLTTFFFASSVFSLSVVVWVQRRPKPTASVPPATPCPTATTAAAPSPSVPTVVPSPGASELPQEEPSPTIAATATPPTNLGFRLIIPVAGIKSSQLRDTYTEARSEGRVHNALDIMAPHNAQVLAATAGKIVKLFNSVKGGVTIYQLSSDQKTVLYYAHLDHYADGLTEGHVANQGEVIGYVGDTGNAGSGNYHLHFAMWSVTDPKRYWDGVNINPYPLLRQQ